MPRLFDQTPPSYLKWARLFLSKSDHGSQLSPFPYIASVTNRIVLCTKVTTGTLDSPITVSPLLSASGHLSLSGHAQRALELPVQHCGEQ